MVYDTRGFTRRIIRGIYFDLFIRKKLRKPAKDQATGPNCSIEPLPARPSRSPFFNDNNNRSLQWVVRDGFFFFFLLLFSLQNDCKQTLNPRHPPSQAAVRRDGDLTTTDKPSGHLYASHEYTATKTRRNTNRPYFSGNRFISRNLRTLFTCFTCAQFHVTRFVW